MTAMYDLIFMDAAKGSISISCGYLRLLSTNTRVLSSDNILQEGELIEFQVMQ